VSSPEPAVGRIPGARKFLVAQPHGVDVPDGFGAGPGVVRWATDVVRPDQELLAVHSLRAHESPWSALHWLWTTDGPPALASPLTAVELVEHVGWAADPGPRAGEPTPGIKQVAFLHPPDGLHHDEFRWRYRAHVGEARRHMPGLWQYVQDVVEPLPDDPQQLHGISELWFESLDDFRERYWAHADSHVEEQEEVGQFLSGRTWSLLVAEHVLRA
jgi:hypothetical protein